MFSNFVTFTEVIKLSPSICFQMKIVNYQKSTLDLIKIRRDYNFIESIFEVIEDKSIINEFVDVLDHSLFYEGSARFIFDTAMDNLHSIEDVSGLFVYACKWNRLDSIKYLTENITNWNYLVSGWSLLMWSTYKGSLEIIKYLGDQGINIEKFPDIISQGLKSNNPEIVRYFTGKLNREAIIPDIN